jgi:phage protein D
MAGEQIQSARFQGYRRRAFCQIIIDGQDVTNRFDPYLISVQVIDNIDTEDECNIELDDRNAQLSIPEDGANVVVKLGWAGEGPRVPLFREAKIDADGHLIGFDWDVLPTDIPPGELPFEASGMLVVFNGFVHNVESGGSRRAGGRRLWIEAKGTRPGANDKTPDMKSWGSGTDAIGNEDQSSATGGGIPLSQVLGDAAAKAGMGLQISPSIGNISRNFWQMNESPRHLAERLAREVGGQVKMSGGNMIITSATDGLNVDGKMLPLIVAEWSVNLISWRIKPYVARSQYAASKSKFFDIAKGLWDQTQKSIGGNTPFGMASATAMGQGAAPNKQVGEHYNGGMSADSELKRGTGWVIFNGEPTALAGNALQIVGARPGVDGNYKIRQAEHHYLRSGGYTTRCDLEKPSFQSGYEHWLRQAEKLTGST